MSIREPTPVGGVPILGALDTALFARLESLSPEDAARVRELLLLGQRRAARLQQLQLVAAALSRTLDETEIVRELARGALRILGCEGVVVAHPDLDAGDAPVAVHLVRGQEIPRGRITLGGGALAEAARTGEPVLVAAYDPIVSALAAADDVVGPAGPAGSVLAAPMMHGRRLLGVIAVHDPATGAFGDEEAEILRLLGAQAASALSNARLFSESERERRQSDALAEIARAVGESLRMGEVLRLILRHAMALLRTEGGYVALRRDDYLHVVAAAGTGELLSGLHLPVASSISGQAVSDGRAIISNDVSSDERAYRPSARIVRVDKALIVPLVTARGTIGVLAVFNRGADFAGDDARVLQRLADQVAVAIVNARLFEEAAEATREWTSAFNSIATGMVLVDETGHIVRYNSRALQLAQLETQRELVGRGFYEAILHERRSPGDDGPLERALREGGVARATLEAPKRGKLFDVAASPHPNGGAIISFEDVTESRGLAHRNRLVVEAASDALFIGDAAGQITFANPAALELFRRDDFTGVALSELVLPDLSEEIGVHLQLALGGTTQRHEYLVLRGDGERRVVAASLAPLREGERVTGLVASMRDVTGERRARDAVALSEARYRNLFETAGDAIFTLDFRGAFTSVNHATSDLLDAPREQLLGRSLFPLVDSQDVDRVTMHVKDALAGEVRRYECTVIRGNGTRRLLSVTNTPIRHGRKIIGALGVARDLTDDRARLEALNRSEARYANLVESASDAIFTVDEEGNFTSINRAFEVATGRTRDNVIGEHFSTLVDPRDRDSLWEVFVGTLHGHRTRSEIRYLDPHQEPRHGSLIATPVVENGRVTGALGVVRDVSEERRLMDQLLQQEKLVAVGNLVSGVAHELNNPLASVMAFSEMLLESPMAKDEDRDALRIIRDETGRAAKIVTNLLTFARQHPPQRTATDINALIAATLELRRYALTVHGVSISEDLAASLPETAADPFQLQQVMLNLLANAEQALRTWDGEKRITIRTWRVAEMISISVQDSGAGIAERERDRIFNPFFTTRGVGQGAGLGLSIADGIVREHGGRIHVDSAPGEGATFVVEIPIVDPPPSADQVVRSAVGEPVAPAYARSILVVDDEPAIRVALTRYLSALGHRVDVAENGAEALLRLASRRYDVIVLDLRMPEIAGDALYLDLLARDPAQAERVVFLSGDAESASARDFLDQTARPFIAKPFTLEDVRRVLTNVAVR